MTNCIFFTGQSVRNSKSDILQPITIQELYETISRPPSGLEELVRKLRVMYTIDKQKYSEMKTLLPYFIPARFRDGIRHSSNFDSIQGFVLDLDDLPLHDLDTGQVFDSLQKDPNVILLFRSPGGYGLKVVFQLDAPMYDTRVFSDFYKSFSLRFARKYQLERVMDYRTSDACRVCFLSSDHDSWFNNSAEPVVAFDYIQPAPFLSDVTPAHLTGPEIVFSGQETKVNPDLPQVKRNVPENVMHEISHLLSPGRNSVRERQPVYVPPQLDCLEKVLENILQKHAISVISCRDIQYGKQLHFASGDNFAEVNVFFGKRGYSLVKTTRSGSNAVLGEKVMQLLASVLIYRAEGHTLATV